MSGNAAAPTFTGEAAGGIPSRGERPVPPRRDGRSDGRHRHSPRHRPRTPNRPGPPRFTSAATLTVSENSTAADTVTAVDDDTGETVTGYAITGDADRFRLKGWSAQLCRRHDHLLGLHLLQGVGPTRRQMSPTDPTVANITLITTRSLASRPVVPLMVPQSAVPRSTTH